MIGSLESLTLPQVSCFINIYIYIYIYIYILEVGKKLHFHPDKPDLSLFRGSHSSRIEHSTTEKSKHRLPIYIYIYILLFINSNFMSLKTCKAN